MRPFLPAIIAWAAYAQGSEEIFESRIRPVLAEKCYSCHDTKTASGGLVLDSKAGVERGGKRGTLLVAGSPDSSLLMRALSHTESDLKMPPGGKLPAAVIEDFKQWIRGGAVDPRAGTAPVSQGIDWQKAARHWAFRPVRDSEPPKPANRTWIRTGVDAFLLAKLEAAGLVPAAPATKRDWLRRVTFDLTGLPPTPAEVTAFLRDTSPTSFDRVTGRLLESPHYGERWARHWLDVVRFAETNGHEFDFYKYEAWRYRDYVIRAFNEDVPYDRFVAEQIAGDLLPSPRLSANGRQLESAVGSGFFGLQEERNGATDLEEVRSEMRDSKIDVFGKAFLGLTIACARCHDHKFDPIAAADYYALGGIVDSTRTTLRSIESPAASAAMESRLPRLPASTPPPSVSLRPGDELFEDFESLGRWHVSGTAFHGQQPGLLDSARGASNKLTGILVSRSFVPKRKYIHVRLAGTTFKPVREEPSLLAVTIFASGRYPKGVAGEGDRKLRWKTITLKEEIGQVCHLEIADRQRDGHLAVAAIVFSDHKEPPAAPEHSLAALLSEDLDLPEEPFGRVSYEDAAHDMRLHVRGSHLNPGEEVPRRFLRILGGDEPESYKDGSGRLALARALTSPGNPLVARVMVNRIWKHHFGEGLVATVDNFGAMGERPSHPELLDWLTARFIESGWSVKAMHRLILGSAAYRMASAPTDAAIEKDPRNRLLSYMPARRLDAESIRDSILSVSGSLDTTVHGPSVTPHISPWQDGRGKPASGPLDGKGRRSVYLEVRRNFLTPLLLAFDYPLPATAAGRRSISSVPSQALALMNNEFVAGEAEKWAVRAGREFHDPGERLTSMYERAFARPPTAAERARVEAFLKQGGTWTEAAHALLNTKEFLFTR